MGKRNNGGGKLKKEKNQNGSKTKSLKPFNLTKQRKMCKTNPKSSAHTTPQTIYTEYKQNYKEGAHPFT